MFEYAISAGEGTLLDYGVTSGNILNYLLRLEEEAPNVYFCSNSDVCYELNDGFSVAYICPATDCQTGQ